MSRELELIVEFIAEGYTYDQAESKAHQILEGSY